MGVIITIREKFGYVIVGLIALAIIAFLVMDATNSRTGIFNRASNNVGTVDDIGLDRFEFNKQVADAEDGMKRNSQDGAISDEQRFTLMQQVWDNFVRKTVMDEQYAKLGIVVTDDEMYDMLQGQNPHPFVVQNFRNQQTGQFDPQQVTDFISHLDEDNPNGGATAEEKKKQWENFKNAIKEDRLNTKYMALIKGGVNVPDWEAKKMAELQQSKVDIDYVYLPYSDVANDQVKPTESELKDYLSKHQAQYKQDASRTIEYVSFDLAPSQTDTAKTLEWINGENEKFATAKSDSLFVRLYSDQPFDPSYLKRSELTSAVADTFFKVDKGTIVGPYLDNGAYVLAKLVDRKAIPDSVRPREIVIGLTKQTNAEYTEKKALADSLEKLLEDGKANFDSLVAQHSMDPQSKAKGGDMGWMAPNPQSVLNANLFFNHNKGDYFVQFTGNNAFRIIHITETAGSETAVKVAFLAKAIVPSKTTKDIIYDQANKFAGTNNTGDKFKEAGKQKAIRTSNPLTVGSFQISGLGTAREIVKWAFTAKKDDVSPIFKLEDKYVIAHLSSVKEKGFASLDEVKPQVEIEVVKEKKAAILKAKAEGANDLAAVASKTGKSPLSASELSFNNVTIQGLTEPKVPSAAMGAKKDQLSLPVVGNTGVFYLVQKNLLAPNDIKDLTAEKATLSSNILQSVDFSVFQVLKDKAAIKDNRMEMGIY